MKDHFQDRAQNWDKGNTQVNGAKVIADAIASNINLTKEMSIMDFGTGTGLLGFEIAKLTKKVYGVDMSLSMLSKLQEKNSSELHIEAICQDIVKKPLAQKFDGIVSSMTLHHVKDLEAFFLSIKKNLNENGFIAIADLEEEDGSFHSENAGVYHFGFQEKALCQIVEKCGFKNIVFQNINTIQKTQKDFGVFLLSATV